MGKLLTRYAVEESLVLLHHMIENITAMILSSIVGAYQLAVAVKSDMPRDYAAKTVKAMVFSYLSVTH